MALREPNLKFPLTPNYAAPRLQLSHFNCKRQKFPHLTNPGLPFKLFIPLERKRQTLDGANFDQ